MAGIGFELRRLLGSETYTGLFRAYAYAGIVGSGPWVLSIAAILVLGFLSLGAGMEAGAVRRFQVSVTWLIASSLVFTGGVQLLYTRYAADRLFLRLPGAVVPNLLGVLLVTLTSGFLLALLASVWLLSGTSGAYRLLMVGSFTLLCMIWVLTVLLFGLKEYRPVVAIYALGYGTVVAAGLALRGLGTEGLLLAFFAGQVILALAMFALVWREYPPEALVAFGALRPEPPRGWLVPAGLLFTLGIWVDKVLFWLWPGTGQVVVGELRASLVYDTPIFLAYITIIPGMAVFLLRMEVDFVRAYDDYYSAVRDGGALSAIRDNRRRMVRAAREGVYDILKVQGAALLLLVAFGDHLLAALGIPAFYRPLLAIYTAGVALQLLVLSALNILFYLNRLRAAAVITAVMVAANATLTALSLVLGPRWYGYGFATGMLITALVAMAVADRTLSRLNYETFMLR